MKPRLKIALGSYDRHGPLLEGAVGNPEFEFEFLEVDPRQGRHERFLQDFEFDACELSFSSYVVAMDQSVPVHAVPIFPRRLFSQSQMYRNLKSVIDDPKDLAAAWDEALSAERPVVLEVKTDPEIAPLPPHISLKEAKNFMFSMAKDEGAGHVIKDTARQVINAVLHKEDAD